MKLVIYGSRTFDDYELLCEVCDKCRGITAVLCGEALGADTLGRKWAEENHIEVLPFPAEWEKYGKKRAGKIRNIEMAKLCDIGQGFWDKKSTGTKHMTGRLKAFNKPHKVTTFVANKFKKFENNGAVGTLDDLFV